MKSIAILSLFLLTFLFAHSQTILTLKLQAGPDEGKDAYTNSASYYASDPHPNGRSLIASAYTYHGDYGIDRSFFAFDLSSLPVNAILTGARLNLFLYPENKLWSSNKRYA